VTPTDPDDLAAILGCRPGESPAAAALRVVAELHRVLAHVATLHPRHAPRPPAVKGRPHCKGCQAPFGYQEEWCAQRGASAAEIAKLRQEPRIVETADLDPIAPGTTFTLITPEGRRPATPEEVEEHRRTSPTFAARMAAGELVSRVVAEHGRRS
jgi:hypothetical protein